MNTEQKIKEAYERWSESAPFDAFEQTGFRAGYLALLNELEPFTYHDEIQTYRLPEGVTKL